MKKKHKHKKIYYFISLFTMTYETMKMDFTVVTTLCNSHPYTLTGNLRTCVT